MDEDKLTIEPNKYKSVKESIDELSIEAQDLFENQFVDQYTDFDSIHTLFKEAGWLSSQGNLDYTVTVGDADEFINEHSDFPSWHRFLNKALDQYWNNKRRNRRRYKRHDCNLKAKLVCGVSNNEYSGKVVDLSKTGLRFEAKDELPNINIAEVIIPELNEQESLKVRGAIRWMGDDKKTIGLETLNKKKTKV